jgi:hypothetical protein
MASGIPMHGDGWTWREPRRGDHFRTCSYCGSIHPDDLADELVPQGACKTCGQVGWEAHFRGLQPSWYPQARDTGQLAGIDPGELARMDAMPPEHSYDPGGAYASWADQKYGWPHKFYVQGIKPRDAGMLHVLSHSTSATRPSGVTSWTAAADLTTQQREILDADGWLRPDEEPDGWWCFAPKTTLFAKFYTAHLADPAIGEEVKDKVFEASGVRLHFDGDGGIRWHASALPCAELHPES